MNMEVANNSSKPSEVDTVVMPRTWSNPQGHKHSLLKANVVAIAFVVVVVAVDTVAL